MIEIVVLTFLVLVISEVYEYFRDKKNWNNGICPVTNKSWEYDGMDFEGLKFVFKSDDHYIHLKYMFIRKY